MKNLRPLALAFALLGSAESEAIMISSPSDKDRYTKFSPDLIQKQHDLILNAIGTDFCDAGDSPNAKDLESFCREKVKNWVNHYGKKSLLSASASVNFCDMPREGFTLAINSQLARDGETELTPETIDTYGETDLSVSYGETDIRADRTPECLNAFTHTSMEEQAKKSAREFESNPDLPNYVRYVSIF